MNLRLRIFMGVVEYCWFVWRDGLLTAYVLPVRLFRSPMQVLTELQTDPERWNLAAEGWGGRDVILRSVRPHYCGLPNSGHDVELDKLEFELMEKIRIEARVRLLEYLISVAQDTQGAEVWRALFAAMRETDIAASDRFVRGEVGGRAAEGEGGCNFCRAA